MKTITAAILCLAIAATVEAGDPVRNAIWWAKLDLHQRALYVTSVFDGISTGQHMSYDTVSARVEERESNAFRNIFQGLTSAEVIRRLDAFYRTKHNQPIIVSDAIMLVAISTHLGASKQAADLYPAAIEEARRRARSW